MALPLRSPAAATARAQDVITARRSEIRARVREITSELRRLLHEDGRLRAGELALGVETEPQEDAVR